MTVKLILSEAQPVVIKDVVKYTDNGNTQLWIKGSETPLEFGFCEVAAVEIVENECELTLTDPYEHDSIHGRTANN